MKKLILLVIVFIVLELGLTYYVGQESEKAYRRIITLLNDTPGIRANTLSYQRGWFKSEAVSEITVGKNTYTFEDKIFHGPITLDVEEQKQTQDSKGFKFPLKLCFCLGVVKSNISSPLNIPITAVIVFPYQGGAHLQSEGGPFEYKDDKEFQIKGSGWNTHGTVNSSFDTYTFQNNVKTIQLKQKEAVDENKTEIEGLKIDVHYEKGKTEDALQVNYAIDSIINRMQALELLGIQLGGNVLIKPEFFDSSFKIDIKKVSDIIGAVLVQVKLENVDKAFFDLFKSGLGKLPSPDQIAFVLKKVLMRGFQLNIEHLEAMLPDGKFSMQSQVSLGGPDLKEPISAETLFAQSVGNLTLATPKYIFNELLQARIAYSLDKESLFKSLPDEKKKERIETEKVRILEALKQSGILTETEQNYLISFAFSKGAWTVDGQPVEKPPID